MTASRRVGKTYLVRNYFHKKPCYFFYVTGIQHEPISRQISEFTKEIGRVFFHGMGLEKKDNWFDTFEVLTEAINKQVTKKKKIVLFFDEFPWMVTHKSKLLQALDFYWNRHWSQDNRIKLIICGSAAAWIIRNIINNKAGLHNRLTKIIQLEPLSLSDTKQFLNNIGVKLNIKHIIQIYMVTGGIPYYLSHIETNESASQVIEKLAFRKNSFLLQEFDNLYSSLFEDGDTYINLVRAISEKRYGINQEELFKKVKNISKGGTIVKRLQELESAGFIISFTPFQHRKKGIFYRVIDEYSMFYFKWIEPIKGNLINKSLRKGYWQNIQQTPRWHSWAGYTFESICYKHLSQISISLSLSPTALPSAWKYTPIKGSKEKGTQIDLLFDRNDDALTICEIKFTDKPFIIDKEYAEKLKLKIETFKKITRINKQIFLAIISASGIKKTIYSEYMVDKIITLTDLFVKEEK